MKELRIKNINVEQHFLIKSESALRHMTIKDFLLGATNYIISNNISIDVSPKMLKPSDD